MKIYYSRYYCRQSASSATPSDGYNADICTAGHYCPEGTAEPHKCPPSTFSPATALVSVDQCLNCTEGKNPQIKLLLLSP